MKKLLLSSAFFLSAFFTNAQAVQDWKNNLPSITTYSFERKVVSDSQGNVYIVGNYNGTATDFDPGSGVFNMNSLSNNMYIVKQNAAGNFVWAKQIGGGTTFALTQASAITIDASDNIYISGYSVDLGGTGIDFDPGTGVVNVMNPSSGGGYVLYILKIDTNGNHIMNKQFKDGTNSAGRNFINDMKVDATGNIYATGCFGGTLDFDPDGGTTNLTSVGNAYSNNIFVMKLNASGTLAWAKGIINTGIGGSNVTDEGYGIDVDSAGNVYTTGYYLGGIDADPGVGVYNLSSAFGASPVLYYGNKQYISKLDASGNFVWAYDLAGDHTLLALPSLKVDSSNNVIISGYQTAISDYDFGTAAQTLPNDTGSFILKTNSNGGFIWVKSTARSAILNGNSGLTYAPGLTLDTAGNIYTTGTFGYGSTDFDPSVATNVLTPPTSGSNVDGYISKLDTNGNFLWANQIGSTGQDGCYAIAVSPLGKVTVLGKSSTGFSKSSAAVTAGGFVASFSQPALATSQFDLDKNISVYPNPTTNEFNIKISENLMGAKATIYNILGQKINQFTLDFLTTTQNLDKGMYLIAIEKDGNSSTKKLLVN